MDWEIHEDSLHIDTHTIEVVLQGRDRKSDGFWEIRVELATMQNRCGAKGSQPDELKRAFEKHREKILSVAYQKYNADQGEPGKDRILIRLYKEDFDTFRERPVP